MTENYSKETQQVFKMIQSYAPGVQLYDYLQKNKKHIDFEETECYISHDTGYNILNNFCSHIEEYPKKEALMILDFLIENTIYIDQMSHDGTTALMNVIRKASKEKLGDAIEKLLGAGANINVFEGNTALMWAALCVKDEEIFKKILHLSSDEAFFAISNEQDYTESDIRKANAAHYAVAGKNINNLKWLIEENIDMSHTNANRHTPLQMLALGGDTKQALELMKEYPYLLEIERLHLINKQRYPRVDNLFVFEEDIINQKAWEQTIKIMAEQDNLQKLLDSMKSIDMGHKKLATQKI